MINACTFITRKCTRSCSYCDAAKVKKEDELDWLDWVHVNGILRDLGVDFNLILGNESWLVGPKLNRIMEVNTVPYALYTTCPDSLFSPFADFFFEGAIDNLSCGIDYAPSYLHAKDKLNSIERKSLDAYLGLKEVRSKYPHVDCQGTVTVNKTNYEQLPEIVKYLSNIGVFIGVNIIHWNKDGQFDFFPAAEDLKDFLFSERDEPDLIKVFYEVLSIKDALVQNKEMLQERLVRHMIKTDWHCQGDPYGGPTIDSDGSLRCCGYRKGDRASQFSIFEMPTQFANYKKAVYYDAKECPGCFWSYPWMYQYWSKRGDDFGKKVFVHHARPELSPDKWSKRKIS